MTKPRETLQILTLNIGNPSRERAERQLEWLQRREEDVLVLTETATSRGCELIAARLAEAGWEVRFPRPVEGERGVLIASRVQLAGRGNEMLSYLPARAERALLAGVTLEIVGAYVPSRDASASKTERKRRFIEGLSEGLEEAANCAILIGDLNIIEPRHQPSYAWFQDWEYDFYRGLLEAGWIDAYRLCFPEGMEHSWVGYEGDGYRYDHAFVTAGLADRVLSCAYVHATREQELTDHSAMIVALRLAGAQPLEVHGSLTGEAGTLF
jgi:exodeoxyribonuclease III